jgi:hypothetical protein
MGRYNQAAFVYSKALEEDLFGVPNKSSFKASEDTNTAWLYLPVSDGSCIGTGFSDLPPYRP